LLKGLGDKKRRLLAHELVEQDLAWSLLVEEVVEWSGSETYWC
jgi:hypothetical protein